MEKKRKAVEDLETDQEEPCVKWMSEMQDITFYLQLRWL